MQTCYLAVDIGASSGRHILGTVRDGRIELKEIYRFENALTRKNGHLCWDLEGLFGHVVAGIKACKDAGYTPVTMGIDTWAVDFVLLDGAGRVLGDTVAYRDERTAHTRAALEAAGTLSFAEHYARTGIQYQPFNTVYQLLALKAEHPAELAAAKTFLMIPDYLHYRLTGVAANEYTNATTTALVGAESKTWDDALIAKLGLPRGIFQPICMPGTALGGFTPEIQAATGLNCQVVLPATHDTGSAFLAVPARDENAVYLSSGTWSLLGVENRAPITGAASCAANFTNEGGYEYRYRYLKNIMGLWMIQSIRRELGEQNGGERPSFPTLIAAAKEAAGYMGRVNPDDPRFLAPTSMIAEVKAACAADGYRPPATTGEVMQCVYNSLSLDYRAAIATLQGLTGKTYTSINVVGGGSQDDYLNQQTANATGLPVFAGPTEGTALGNLIVQCIANGEYQSLQAARDAIKNSFTIKEVTPQ
ncbi:MAG: rhamnulokinase [Gemmiger sp.]|nr:rhamnulokinase [Gemmiger sp.]